MDLKSRTFTVRAKCPECQVPFDSATAVTEVSMPRPGAVAICAYCITPLRYVASLIHASDANPSGLTLVKLDLAALSPENRSLIEMLVESWRKKRAENPSPH